MAISKEQLGAIIANKAAALCKPEYDGNRGRQNLGESRSFAGGPSPSAYDNDAASRLDSLVFNSYDDEPDDNERTSQIESYYLSEAAKKSGMPDAIKNSMMKNVIDVSALDSTSVLGSLGIKPQAQKRQITEQASPQMQHSVVGNGVDYSIIKAIVSECIKEYFSNQMLNEGALKTVYLKGGTISLVDNSGNVFKAKLEKVKNLNEDKKQ